MSYILDALKKQEQDRDIGHTPTLDSRQETPSVGLRTASMQIGIVVIVLLAIVAFLTGYLWSQLEKNSLLQAQLDGKQRQIQPERITPQPIREVKSVNSVPLDITERSTVKAVSKPQFPLDGAEVPKQVANPEPDIVLDKTKQSRTHVPLYEELRVTELRDVPELSLDVHVYAESLDRRFVLINLKKLREGESIGEVILEAITPEGVLLSHQGIRFRILRE